VKKKKVLTEKQLQLQRKVAVMKLKGKAEGTGDVPESRRMFLSVSVVGKDTGAASVKPLALCCDLDTSIGHLIDKLAARFSIPNHNNMAIAEASFFMFVQTRCTVKLLL
jgi:hypothetical protein